MSNANAVNTTLSGQSGTGNFAGSASPTFTGTVTVPTPFTLGATSVTSTGTQLNLLNTLASIPITTINIQSFTSTGSFTYTPTSGMKYCIVSMIGGGGGGGGATGVSAQTAAAGGGASGYYIQFLMTAAQIGASKTGTVGAGGLAGAAAAGTGGTGGDTVFADWTAGGGQGGVGSTASASTKVSAGGAPGTITVGTGTILNNMLGSSGAPGLSQTTIIAQSGFGATSGGDLGGSGGTQIIIVAAASVAGINGSGGGSGGSGAATINNAVNVAGGIGKNGRVLVVEYISA